MAISGLLVVSCGQSKEDILRSRAEKWFDSLSRIKKSDMNEDNVINEIKDLIEPSAANKDRAIEYYRRWKDSSSELVSFSVDDVRIDASGKGGLVRVSDVWLLSNGEKITVSQETEWKLVNGKWFRIIKPAKITVGLGIPLGIPY